MDNKKTFLEGNWKLDKIAIDKLYPSPDNTYNPEELDDLIGSIKTCGLITPLTVLGPTKKGTYEILSGERRYRSLKMLSKENKEFANVPCYIINSLDNEYHKKLIIESSNLETREFDKNEHRMNILKIVKEMGADNSMTDTEIFREASKYMKVSNRYARMYNAIFESDSEELKQLVQDKKINVSEGSRIATMDKKEQKEVLDRLKSGEKASSIFKEKSEKKKKPEDEAKKISEEIKNGEREKANNSIGKTISDEKFLELVNSDDTDDFSEILSETNSTPKLDVTSVGNETLADMRKPTSQDLTSKESFRDDFAKKIRKWCDTMMSRTPDDLTEEEEKALESLSELLEYYNYN